MSLHPSLRASDKSNKQRSVLKRPERLRMMQSKEQWKEGDTVFGLPKVKTLRLKIKKEKSAEKVAAATGAAPAAGAGAPAAAPAGKTAAKPAEKK